MKRHLPQLAVLALCAQLVACGSSSAPGMDSAQPTGQLKLAVDLSNAPGVTIAVQNVFDPSQVFLVDCLQKTHLLNGEPFCDELLVLPPGVYEVIAQSQDPNCQTAQNHYKVVVAEEQTAELQITLVCASGNGGLDVIVSTEFRPTIVGLAYSFPAADGGTGFPASQNDCACGADVQLKLSVEDDDTACANLTGSWKAFLEEADGGTQNVTATVLSNFQQSNGGQPCLFSATFDSSAGPGNYFVSFSASDGTPPPTEVAFPVNLINCGLCAP